MASSGSPLVVTRMHHQVIAHVEDQAKFVKQAATLLRPGGYLILSTNNKFVMERLGDMDWGSHRADGHIENWLSIGDLKRLLTPEFRLTKAMTMLPMGSGGVLRLVNSVKLNLVLTKFITSERLRRAKERIGLGYYILVVGQKPATNER